jgi:hypothetical protein
VFNHNNIEIFPFTEEQLKHFKKEIEDAGSYEELMILKEALKDVGGYKETCLHEVQNEYKKKHLRGVYKPLRLFYDTEMPYIFWNAMHQTLLRYEKHLK